MSSLGLGGGGAKGREGEDEDVFASRPLESADRHAMLQGAYSSFARPRTPSLAPLGVDTSPLEDAHSASPDIGSGDNLAPTGLPKSSSAALSPTSPQPRQRIKSTPTARRVRSRQLLVDLPTATLFRDSQAHDRASASASARSSPIRRGELGQRIGVGAGQAQGQGQGWAVYKVMPEEYYGRVAFRGEGERGRDREEGIGVQSELCADALRGLRYMEEGLKTLQGVQDPSRTHALAFSDLGAQDEAVIAQIASRRAPANSLGGLALGYLSWLDIFEDEVYTRLLPLEAARSALPSLRGESYSASIDTLALVSDLTYAREILRRECVLLVWIAGVWDLRGEVERKIHATQLGVRDLQDRVRERVEEDLAELARAGSGQNAALGPSSTSLVLVNISHLAESIAAIRKIALPAIAQNVARVMDAVQEGQTASVRLVRPGEALSFARPPADESSEIEARLLEPLRKQLDELDGVLRWVEDAQRGWRQYTEKIRRVEAALTAEATLAQDIDALALSDVKAEQAAGRLADLTTRDANLQEDQSFDRIALVNPPDRFASMPWIVSATQQVPETHEGLLPHLDDRTISFARKISKHSSSLTWLRTLIEKRQEIEGHHATLREVLHTLGNNSQLSSGDIDALQALVDIPAKELPIRELELKQIRRQDPRTGISEVETTKIDQQMLKRVWASLDSVPGSIRSARTVVSQREEKAAEDRAFAQVSQDIDSISREAADVEESLLTLLEVAKWHVASQSTPSPANVKKDSEILLGRWIAQVKPAVQSVRQRYSERAQRLAAVIDQSQALHQQLTHLQHLASAVEETHYQKEYVIEVFATAADLQASLDRGDAHTEKDLTRLDQQISRTPMVARQSTASDERRTSAQESWDDRERLGQRAAELATLTPPSSPRNFEAVQRQEVSPGESRAPDRVQQALKSLTLVDAQIRRALSELSVRLHAETLASGLLAGHDPSRQIQADLTNKSISHSTSVASGVAHSTSAGSVKARTQRPDTAGSASRHSLYDETASTRARRISTMADREKQAGERQRSRVISESASHHAHQRRPSSMLSTSTSMQSLRSSASAESASHGNEIISTPMPKTSAPKRQSWVQPKRTITRANSNTRLRRDAVEGAKEVEAHPRLDAAIRKTVQVHKQEHLDIEPASPARTDKDCIEGAYTFRYGDKSATRFCRIMVESDKVWVRVGGGFESLDEFLNRTFSAFIHQALAEPVSSETSHATLMGFESPEAMSRVLHAQVSPNQSTTPTRQSSASPVTQREGTPLAHRAHLRLSTRIHGEIAGDGPEDRTSPWRQRSGSASPVTMRSSAASSPSLIRRFSVTSASPVLRRQGSD